MQPESTAGFAPLWHNIMPVRRWRSHTRTSDTRSTWRRSRRCRRCSGCCSRSSGPTPSRATSRPTPPPTLPACWPPSSRTTPSAHKPLSQHAHVCFVGHVESKTATRCKHRTRSVIVMAASCRTIPEAHAKALMKKWGYAPMDARNLTPSFVLPMRARSLHRACRIVTVADTPSGCTRCVQISPTFGSGTRSTNRRVQASACRR